MAQAQFLDRPGEPRLSWQLDAPAQGARGKVLLVHGYADHMARFDHVTKAWVERGLVVGRFDLRGHGRSEGTRGHVMSVAEYVGDAQAVLAKLENEPAWKSAPGRPVLFGHSLGGLISTKLALQLGDRVAGFASTSPFFAVKRRVTPIEFYGGKLALRLFPRLRQPSRLEGVDMTHDANIAASYDRDPYHFGHVTIGFFFAVLDAQNEALDRAPELAVPLFCIAAGEDRVVDLAATERFFERAGSAEKELDISPGSFHELLNELDWKHHASRLAERMLQWSGT